MFFARFYHILFLEGPGLVHQDWSGKFRWSGPVRKDLNLLGPLVHYSEATRHYNSINFLILLPLRADLLYILHNETPCIQLAAEKKDSNNGEARKFFGPYYSVTTLALHKYVYQQMFQSSPDCRTGHNKGRYHQQEFSFLLVSLISIIICQRRIYSIVFRKKQVPGRS